MTEYGTKLTYMNVAGATSPNGYIIFRDKTLIKPKEIIAMLKEYETLKAATDMLGLEWARQFVEDCDEAMETTSGVTMEIYRSDIELLRGYADTLEGEP